ncbi:hypothetical protein BLX87_20370 [Bacillus sp. VT-16-64]|nr:hypothetical protein BLX87_20370 [Bacillus sp. VT-16-64]
MLVEPIGHLGAVISHLDLLYPPKFCGGSVTAPYMREKKIVRFLQNTDFIYSGHLFPTSFIELLVEMDFDRIKGSLDDSPCTWVIWRNAHVENHFYKGKNTYF